MTMREILLLLIRTPLGSFPEDSYATWKPFVRPTPIYVTHSPDTITFHFQLSGSVSDKYTRLSWNRCHA